jgi:hypothetical protein
MPEPITEIPIKVLATMIARTSFAISMEESRFTLNGALLLMRPEGLTMVATDGHRLAYVQAKPEQIGERPGSPAPEGKGPAHEEFPLSPADKKIRKAISKRLRLSWASTHF